MFSKSRFHSFFLIVVLGALTAFAPLSVDMYLPAFSKIAEAYGVAEHLVELSLTSFFIGMALGQLLYGPLSDRFGRKPPLYFGLVLYAVMSVACSLAANIESLIVFRFFQALGACTGVVIARAMVRDLFKPQESARIFSLLILVLGVAPILAPLLGGYIATFFSWRGIFWIHAFFGFTCLLAVRSVLPESRKPDPTVHLKNAFRIYWSIARNREFLGYAISCSLAQSGMFAYITGSPFVFIELFHIQAQSFGWLFGTNAFGLIAASQLNARLLKVYPSQVILRRTFLLLPFIGIFLGIVGILNLGFWPIAIGIFSYLSLLGMIFSNAVAGALAKQGATAGSASALLGFLQFTIAFAVSAIVSHFHNATSLPMTLTMGACGITSYLIFRFVILSKSLAAQ